MFKKYVFLGLCFIALSVLVPAWGVAEDAEITAIKEIVQNKVVKINTWNSLAERLAMLTLSVAILGALSGVLTQLTAKWAKIAIALSGAAIAIITAIINTQYPVDYRTYKKLRFVRIKVEKLLLS